MEIFAQNLSFSELVEAVISSMVFSFLVVGQRPKSSFLLRLRYRLEQKLAYQQHDGDFAVSLCDQHIL
jgi:hypothetical protein